jgi:hypothetical protein
VAGVFAGLSQMPPGTRIRTELKDLEVMGVGGSGAIARSAFTTAIGEGAGAFTFGGLMTIVLERSDGSWRIIAGHVSEGT